MDTACPVCGRATPEKAGRLPFYLREGEAESTILRCCGCGTWWRSFPSPVDLHDHFAVASYSNPNREDEWRQRRQSFFAHLVRLTLRTLQRTPDGLEILDVGCAYGHLMETFAQKGCRCTGIEPVAAQRARVRDRGAFLVHTSIEEMPRAAAGFDAILAIDSLYYMPGPPAVHLQSLAGLLKPAGVLIVRIANRTPALRLLRALGRPLSDRTFGDALFVFSHRGMKHLLEASGLRLDAVHGYEHKSVARADVRGFSVNRVLPAVAACTGLKISSGLTYVCRKRS